MCQSKSILWWAGSHLSKKLAIWSFNIKGTDGGYSAFHMKILPLILLLG